MKCTIIAELEVTPNYLSLKPDKKGLVKQMLTLTTQKKDLQVEDVTFKENQKSVDQQGWQTTLPLRFAYKFAKSTEPQKGDLLKYQLDISLTTQDSVPTYGVFTIKTNHPKKKEVTLSGVILEPEK